MTGTRESKNPVSIADILAGMAARGRLPEAPGSLVAEVTSLVVRPPEGAEEGEARYDFDLAEFPLFRFYTTRLLGHGSGPIVYSDVIVGKDRQQVTREWKVYPGPFGFGGPSTQVLLYDLLQLYAEQGFRGSQLQFGTLRALFLRRGTRNPSKDDYARLRRDIDVLRGYDFHCKNAFWDTRRRACVDMNWRLFGSVFYFKERSGDDQAHLPFGFIEISPVLQEIARTRGFFALGFDTAFFYGLKPLEQRLAVYLAKKFVSQKLHRRFVEQLAKALPIEAARPRDTRAILARAADGLLAKGLPILKSSRLEQSSAGPWVAVFERKLAPKQDARLPRAAGELLAPAVASVVMRITDAVGSADDHRWWAQCVSRLGAGAADRALGQLKEACHLGTVKNCGGLLTKIFKDIAEEAGVALH